jgi:predicted dehydrogenase
MNYGVIGTGYWGTNHVRVAAELKEENQIDSVVLCDVDEERVEELAKSYSLPYVTDHSELTDRGVDAVTLATPSTTHYEIATDLLEDGMDVLVEKPLALTSDDAWKIVDVANENDRTLAVGHIFRYHPALRELKRRIERGELGRIKYLKTSRFSFRVPRSTTGALYSLAVHDVDISNYLLDDRPEHLYCNLDSVIREGIDETATVVLEYGDATSVINESWQVPVFGKERSLTVVGSEKAAYIDYLEDNVIEMYDSRVVEREGTLVAHEEGKNIYEVKNREPLRVEVEEFVEASRSKSETLSPGHIGAETVEILEKAETSAKEDNVVRLE